MVARAPKGDQPGGLATETTQMTAKVIAIDSEKRKATLQFEDGNIRDLPDPRRRGPEPRKVGEQVSFRVTEMIAIRVEKPQ